MPNPLLHANAWTVMYSAEDDVLRISPRRLRLSEPIDLLVFPGGGFTPATAVWRTRRSRTPLRIQQAGTA